MRSIKRSVFGASCAQTCQCGFRIDPSVRQRARQFKFERLGRCAYFHLGHITDHVHIPSAGGIKRTGIAAGKAGTLWNILCKSDSKDCRLWRWGWGWGSGCQQPVQCLWEVHDGVDVTKRAGWYKDPTILSAVKCNSRPHRHNSEETIASLWGIRAFQRLQWIPPMARSPTLDCKGCSYNCIRWLR